jgi:hypothetical protein
VSRLQFVNGQAVMDRTNYFLYRWVDAVDPEFALQKTGTTAAFFNTFADGQGGVVREKNVDTFVPGDVETTFVGVNDEFSYGKADAASQLALWKFDPRPNAINYQTNTEEDVWRKTDVVKIKANGVEVGELQAFGRATKKTSVNVNIADFEADFKAMMQGLATIGSSIFYQYSNGSGSVLTSQLFRNEFAAILPGAPTLTQALLDQVAAAQALAIRDAIKADFDPIEATAAWGAVDAIEFVDTGGDVTMQWQPDIVGSSGGQIYGNANEYDYDFAYLRQTIGTPGRADPVTGNT